MTRANFQILVKRCLSPLFSGSLCLVERAERERRQLPPRCSCNPCEVNVSFTKSTRLGTSHSDAAHAVLNFFEFDDRIEHDKDEGCRSSEGGRARILRLARR